MKKRDVLFIIGIIICTMLYCFSLFNCLFLEKINEILNICTVVLFCLFFIPLFFSILSKSTKLNDWEYNGIQLIYALVPMGLFGQYKNFSENWVILVSLILTLATSILICKKIKYIDIVHILKLKYSNFLLFVLFTIFLAILCLINKEKETYIFITCISPLLVLQIIYEKRICNNEIQKNNIVIENGVSQKNIGDIIIRCADFNDYSWLNKQEKNISNEILKIKINAKEIYVVQKEEELIGWLRYNLFWDSIPFMNMIYFLEKYRNKGFGKKLVNYWENEMGKKGYSNILTSTLSNEEAQHFYRKIGFKEIGGFNYLEEPLEIIFYKKL